MLVEVLFVIILILLIANNTLPTGSGMSDNDLINVKDNTTSDRYDARKI